MSGVAIRAATAGDYPSLRALLREYAAMFQHRLCFQSFEDELAGLPGDYAPPDGFILLASVHDAPAGCIALRSLSDEVGELKRLFVRPEFRRHGLGRQLVTEAIRGAVAAGKSVIRLDSLPEMTDAQRLYRSLGFYEIPPYLPEPVEVAICMEWKTRPATAAIR